MTIASGLRGRPNPDSQANGALMRVSPLGIFGTKHDVRQVMQWAMADAGITHPHPICLHANALFTAAISHAIQTGYDTQAVYDFILAQAVAMEVHPDLLDTIKRAAESPPADYIDKQGWVLIAFQNALWQMLHAANLEDGVVDTVMRGGDTDTNAAICGALLGAMHGRDAVPPQWVEKLKQCRPKAETQGVHHSRPECFRPVDAVDLADRLVTEQDAVQ